MQASSIIPYMCNMNQYNPKVVTFISALLKIIESQLFTTTWSDVFYIKQIYLVNVYISTLMWSRYSLMVGDIRRITKTYVIVRRTLRILHFQFTLYGIFKRPMIPWKSKLIEIRHFSKNLQFGLYPFPS